MRKGLSLKMARMIIRFLKQKLSDIIQSPMHVHFTKLVVGQKPRCDDSFFFVYIIGILRYVLGLVVGQKTRGDDSFFFLLHNRHQTVSC
jgi:hypothetical protein